MLIMEFSEVNGTLHEKLEKRTKTIRTLEGEVMKLKERIEDKNQEMRTLEEGAMWEKKQMQSTMKRSTGESELRG